MQITIIKTVNAETNTPGYHITFSKQTGKRQIHDADFFEDGSNIEAKVQQLKNLLTAYFATVDTNAPPV